jgi:cation:H+ antiporter
MVVSINASLKGNPALSLGNVVGSNIMNVALILGIASLIKPIQCSREIVRRETPIMIFTIMLMWLVAYTDKVITPAEGIIMFVMLFAYTGLSYYWSRKESAIAAEIAEKCDEFAAGEAEKMPTTTTNFLYVVAGMIGLVIGSEVLVRGAVEIATTLGLSDEVIGLTLIAIGTSLPELATSIAAARKGQSEIALGNVVGSNIFNVLGIVGCAASISWFNTTPETQVLVVSPNMLGLHIPLMAAVSLGVLPIMSTGMRIIRAEGALLVAVYIAYNVILFQTTSPEVPVKPDLNKMVQQMPEMNNPTTTATSTLPIEKQPAQPIASVGNQIEMPKNASSTNEAIATSTSQPAVSTSDAQP